MNVFKNELIDIHNIQTEFMDSFKEQFEIVNGHGEFEKVIPVPGTTNLSHYLKVSVARDRPDCEGDDITTQTISIQADNSYAYYTSELITIDEVYRLTEFAVSGMYNGSAIENFNILPF